MVLFGSGCLPGSGALGARAGADLQCTGRLINLGPTRAPIASGSHRSEFRRAADGRRVLSEVEIAGCQKRAYYALTCEDWLWTWDRCAWRLQPAWAPYFAAR
jgi:hypothetical protein